MILHRNVSRRSKAQKTGGFPSVAREGVCAIICSSRAVVMRDEEVELDRVFVLAEVMGEKHREQVDLIPNPGAGGDIAERVVRFELGEDPFMAAPTVWKTSVLRAPKGLLVRMTLNS